MANEFNELPVTVVNGSESSDYPAGYFRIGHVVLDIPPTSISTNKVANNDQISTLRTGTPMFVNTGQARWDVTIQWKAVRAINPNGSFDYTQWGKLRDIVAIHKAAPFVEVENQLLRQHFTNIQAQYATQRMAFALRQLRIDTDPNTTNVLNVTLTMSLFNYAPFSKDFGYKGGDAGTVSVSASDSNEFRNFIRNWQTTNMNLTKVKSTNPSIADWHYQDDGVLTIKWRNYTYVPFSGNTQPAATSRASSNLTPQVPPRTSKFKAGKLSDDTKALIDRIATSYGLNPSIVEAQCFYESRGNPNAISPTGAVGLLQLLTSTAGLSRQELLDPATNIDAGCKYLKRQLKNFGNYYHALGAYDAGPGYVYAYRDGKTLYVKDKHGRPKFAINPEKIKTDDGLPPAGIPKNENARAYVNTILTNAGVAVNQAPVKSTDGTVQSQPTSTALVDVPSASITKLLEEAIQTLPKGEWFLDHYTQLGAFFFEENEMVFASGDSEIEGDFQMFPSQLSVVFVNNLPSIPLSAMQYPTFQHVGPTDTMISIAFDSVGDDSTSLSEAEHEGIEAIAAMLSQLDSQFHDLRAQFRAVSSIHRMQAVFMENPFLNMLGIEGTLIRGLSTETVEQSTNLIQATLMASQYENIFEESSPFRINGLAAANKQPIKDLLKSGELNNVSQQEKTALSEMVAFGNAWKSGDVNYWIAQMFEITSEPLNPFPTFSGIDSASLRPDQKNTLLANMDLSITGTNQAPGILGAASQIFIPGKFLGSSGGLQFQRDAFPGLQERRLQLASPSGDMTYADFLMFTHLPQAFSQKVIDDLRNQVETIFASKKTSQVDLLFQNLFDWKALVDPIFSRESQLITESPAFKDRFNKGISVNGPAAQPINTGHGCYRDLGLGDSAEPAGYFIDHNATFTQDINTGITQILGKADQTAADANRTQTVQGASTSPGFVFVGDNQGLQGSANALIRMKNVPAYTMAGAYPTFKLLLIEEDNSGPFFAFDNFYSYSSVIDIEVIKYRDKPDTAIIQLTNLSHLLQHRLYDDTAAGKMERRADPFNADSKGGLVSGGPGVSPGEVGTGGNPTSGITASKTAAGVPYQQWMAKNLTEGPTPAFSRVPLKFFALQTGSKIQVRMGYANNPDALFPVFTGVITQIDGDEILTITCQSFMLELMQVPGTTVTENSRFGFNFLSGGAAFGGYSLTTSGDTLNVMKTMLQSPMSKHFGYWQVKQIADPKIKGFEWSSLGGKILNAISSDNSIIHKVGSLLQTGYDRSGENILVNSEINMDATKSTDKTVANATRMSYQQENPNLFMGSARYGIDKQSKRSIYEIIKDISRRYPHFNLMVKDYGFPFEADATLVYAHPLDWYFCRPPLHGDAEKEAANNNAHKAEFQPWWTSVGLPKWNQIWKESLAQMSEWTSLFGLGIRTSLLVAQSDLTQRAGSGPENFNQTTLQVHQILSGEINTPPADSTMDRFFNALQDYWSIVTKEQLSINPVGSFFANMDSQFQALYKEWLRYLMATDPAANSSRLKPVRKYHLIDHNHIVHNGISVDDQIYNCVKIGDLKPFKFNGNIPDQHTRILDVTDQIEDIDNNVFQGFKDPLANSYAQSFLREEVGKMYRGDLIIRGTPEIEPFDIVLLNDISTGTIGPVEVDTVIHSFNLENGFITIVKPRLMVLANESVSTNIIQNLAITWANASSNLHDLSQVFNPFSLGTTTTARVTETGVSVAGILAVAGALAWAPPLGITAAALGLLVAGGIYVWAGDQDSKNYFKLMPLSRFGRPWIGGLQGFAISNFGYFLEQKFQWFEAEEIMPTIESWRELMKYRMDYLPPGQ